MNPTGKILIVAGLVLLAVGAIFLFLPRNFIPGQLPGDIVVRRKNFTFFFPVVTSIMLSVGLSLVFYLIHRFFK